LGQGERRSHGVEQGRDGEVPSSGHDQTGGDARGDAARDAKAAVPEPAQEVDVQTEDRDLTVLFAIVAGVLVVAAVGLSLLYRR
jgi:hypothetical protein